MGTVLAAALTLSGCGGDDDESGSDSPSASEQATSGETDGGAESPAEPQGEASSYEGDWYIQNPETREIGTLTFAGGTVTLELPGGTCNGSVAEPKVTLKCGDEQRTGDAVVSEGDQKLVITWENNGGSDDFTRQKPS